MICQGGLVKSLSLLCLLSFGIFPARAYSADALDTRPALVVSVIENKTQNPQIDQVNLVDRLVTTLTETRQFRLIEREKIQELLKEQKFQMSGLTDEEIKRGMASFRGVDRRFDFKIKNDKVVFLSDYAHHPSEIKQSILSMRALYRDKKLTAVFQPHLYTRTRDFYKDFADSLSLLDEVILVDIYPAREQPIPGVTSKLIYDHLRPGIEKSMCKKEEILDVLSKKDIEVLITLGAGDIDNYVPQICGLLNKR